MATSVLGAGSVSFGDGTSQSSAWTGPHSYVFYGTPGNYSFTIPGGVTAMKVSVVGGGGGGSTNMTPGGGGGHAISWFTGLTPGATIGLTLAAGGAGGAPRGLGSPGGTSSVYSGTQNIPTLSATGGKAGGFSILSSDSGLGSGGNSINGYGWSGKAHLINGDSSFTGGTIYSGNTPTSSTSNFASGFPGVYGGGGGGTWCNGCCGTNSGPSGPGGTGVIVFEW